MSDPAQAPPDDLGRLIAQARRRTYIACARAMEARGGSMLAFVVLARLARAGPASQRDLALHAAQHPAGMSRLLGALEREGLVERRPDGADRRRRLVAATPAGCDRAAAWRPLVRAAAAEVLSVLEAPEQARLASLLRKLVAGRHG